MKRRAWGTVLVVLGVVILVVGIAVNRNQWGALLGWWLFGGVAAPEALAPVLLEILVGGCLIGVGIERRREAR